MYDHGELNTGLSVIVSTAAMSPVFVTWKVNGALEGAELRIVGAVYEMLW
jgi:hypothetical protein